MEVQLNQYLDRSNVAYPSKGGLSEEGIDKSLIPISNSHLRLSIQCLMAIPAAPTKKRI